VEIYAKVSSQTAPPFIGCGLLLQSVLLGIVGQLPLTGASRAIFLGKCVNIVELIPDSAYTET